ncbi:unnamed protein product [Porites evermanni]|uniref:DEAD/DEAH-box helicase domain-containing protein n=1 Tax=Porites evermanni TaxID=104178 RepID=A0ABN8NBM7_9CNID|nr:unnamed protein product [Porites evermanni]
MFTLLSMGADGELLGKIMADSAALSTDKALERLYVSREKQKIILKREQETAMKKLLAGHDVMVILPTGFGKSLIFTRKDSIIDDQIAKMASLNFTALELSGENLTPILRDPPQFLYCTAEKALQTPFLGELKNKQYYIYI